jgi:hypothetical protein
LRYLRSPYVHQGAEKKDEGASNGKMPINIAYPAAEALHLRNALGTRRFKAKPGEVDA